MSKKRAHLTNKTSEANLTIPEDEKKQEQDTEYKNQQQQQQQQYYTPAPNNKPFSPTNEVHHFENTSINEDINDMMFDISHSINIKNILANPNPCGCDMKVSKTINQTVKVLEDINKIKTEMQNFSLNTCESQFYTYQILPLLSILENLAGTSSDLSSSVINLQTSVVVFPKKSKLRKTTHLVYDINSDCYNIYKVLHRRINSLIDCASDCSINCNCGCCTSSDCRNLTSDSESDTSYHGSPNY